MKQFQIVAARFSPKRKDDLIEGVEPFIGRPSMWQAVFEIDHGQFEGQWAMMNIDLGIHPPFAWVPESDLEVMK